MLSSVPVLPLAKVLLLLSPPAAAAEEVAEAAIATDDGTVWLLDGKAEIGSLPETVETAFVEVGPDDVELELGVLEEL